MIQRDLVDKNEAVTCIEIAQLLANMEIMLLSLVTFVTVLSIFYSLKTIHNLIQGHWAIFVGHCCLEVVRLTQNPNLSFAKDL